jgi:hypothetical protein
MFLRCATHILVISDEHRRNGRCLKANVAGHGSEPMGQIKGVVVLFDGYKVVHPLVMNWFLNPINYTYKP